MKNFEQRRAEIFRRSEERIRKRKQNRSRLLAMCIPLVLCIGAVFAFITPFAESDRHPEVNDQHSISQSNETILADAENTQPENSQSFDFASILQNIRSVQVFDDSFSCTHTDPDAVAQITGILGTVTGDRELSDETASDAVIDRNSDRKETAFTIIMTASDGSVAGFTLTGAVLVNRATLAEYTLTARELAQLLEALDIPGQ